MSIGFRSIDSLNNAAAAIGKKVSEIPGDGGGGPAGFTLIASATGLIPGQPCTLEVFPSNGVFASGADGNGNISASVTWINSGDDRHFLQVAGGVGDFVDGFMNSLCRAILSIASNNIGFDIQFSTGDFLGFTQDLVGGPGPNTYKDPTWDGSLGEVTLDMHYDDTLSETPDSIAIVRDGVVIASVPIILGTKDYEYIDTLFAAGTYVYSFFVYKYPDSRSPISSSFSLTLGGPPTFEMIASGGISFGSGATFQFLVNPSGLYKLTANKTHDTIYTNSVVDNGTINVKIPDPYIKTGFLP